MKSKNHIKKFKKNLEVTLLALPGFLWFLVFSYLPMFGIVLAFKKFSITNGNFIMNIIKSEWTGFDNFKFVFQTNDAFIMIRNTLLYNIIFIVLNIIIPFAIALIVNELLQKRAAKIYQTIIFFPYFLSWVIISYFVFVFLSPDKGLVNGILRYFNKDIYTWYSEAAYWPFILTFLNVWKSLGYNMVIYLSAIVGIDKTYFEAASLDGASKLQMVRNITIPQIKPLIIVLFLIAIGNVFKSDFGLFYRVPRNSGSLFPATQTIDTYVFRVFKVVGDIGMSSAVAFLQSIVGLVFIVSCNLIIKKFDKENSLF